MARFSNDQIECIKQDISLQRLVEGKGIELKKHGKDLIGHCPFHNDKTPSFVVSPAKNLWNCLGACGEGGSVIDWVMKTEGVSFRHAVGLLREDIDLVATPKTIHQSTVPKLASPVAESAEDQVVLKQVIDFYHQTLKQEPEAQDYLRKRGLDDVELINHFKLGFANRSLGLRLPYKNRAAGKAIREQLQKVGIYRETGREHFNGSFVVPVINNQQVLEIYGRKLLDNLRKGTPKHTYLPGAHRGVLNIEGLANSDEIILCEALIDALTFWRWGFRHVTSSYGINGFTDEILQTFISNKIKRVLIAYDRDDAGNKAAKDVAALLNKNGIDAFRVLFPKGMDANQFALQTSPATKALGLVIRKAEWLGKGNAPAVTSSSSLLIVESKTESVQATKTKTEDEVKIETFSGDAEASPLPKIADEIEVVKKENDLHITLGAIHYRIRGLDTQSTRYAHGAGSKNNNGDQLKVNLMASREEFVHVDKLDLYSHKLRQVFVNQASVELGVKEEVIKKDLGKLLLKLESIQEQNQQEQRNKQDKNKTVELSQDEHKNALALLKDKKLLDTVLSDFAQAGVVGEEANKLVGYLACVSRKLERPLAVLIQSSSAAGKSSLMDSILSFIPEEDCTQYSAMTGQSLFYMGETNLKNKILAISEEEGARNASYALKLLQSEGSVTIASTGKDETTGDLVTKEYTVEGPVMLFLTTTAIDIDEELLNRCVVLSVNESRQQTQAIHAAQRSKRTLQGLQHKVEKQAVIKLHQNAQRLLKSLQVINPYADQLTFLDDKTRTRRDHEKYLTLIDSIALLHQYQREVKTLTVGEKMIEYVEVELSDIEMANQLAHEVLGRTLDELPPQTRKLLTLIHGFVSDECKKQNVEQSNFYFSRKQVRDACGWSYTQVKVHLDRLVEMEYLLIRSGSRGQSFVYELLYEGEGEEGNAFLLGLIGIEELSKNNINIVSTTESSRGKSPQLTGSKRPHNGGVTESKNQHNLNGYQPYTDKLTETEKSTSAAVC